MSGLVPSYAIPDIQPTKQPGQKSMGFEDAFLARVVPIWNMPPTFDAYAWRNLVASQPVAVICRDTLISSILSLDWKITVRDSKYQDDLAATVRYYTALLERAGYGCDLDWTSHVEWIGGDILDTSFGGASELGRDGDSPNGRVRWIEPIDSGTLSPTSNMNFPVIQYYGGKSVPLPKYAVARAYMSPRSDIRYRGWGIAPPERAFLALQMMSKGDQYYANLLLDIPTTGILDLGDMEQKSAREWVESYQSLLANGNVSSFRIPVLYEHEKEVKFIPFGKVPNDIMFDRITLRYASLIAAAYGMSLSDIGISTTSNGGETLAGSIRSERKTRKTGFARLKKKLKYYFEQIIPPTLQFQWVDYDDEVNLALGKARLANASAFSMLAEKKFIVPNEGRQQMIADGMFTISMPESVDESAIDTVSIEDKNPKAEGTGRTLGDPVAPSMGGHGAITKDNIARIIDSAYPHVNDVIQDFGYDNPHIIKAAIISALEKTTEEEQLVVRSLADIILQDDALDLSDPDRYNSVLDVLFTELNQGEI